MLSNSNIKISMQILKQISEIDEFNGKWKAINITKSEHMKKLKKVSTIESIGSSNRIEGNSLTNEEIETILQNIEKQSLKNRNEEEVACYAELLNTIYDNYLFIPLTENHIKQLHGILLKNVSKDERHRGDYKKTSNAVAAFDADGKEIGIILDTASSFDTPTMMNELIAWTNSALKDELFHPLITIGIFVVHFLAIHPFQDGNGRLSRALTNLLLLKTGYSYVPYCSLEAIVEESKRSYYSALRNTQKHIWDDNVDYEPWLNFFILSLYKQKKQLEDKIQRTEKYADLSDKAIVIMKLFETNNTLTAKIISEKTNFSIETVRKILQKLLHFNFIKKYGTTITRRYSINTQNQL